MGQRETHSRAVDGRAEPRSAPNGRNGGGPVVLSDDELALVLAACQRYHRSLPVYLASSRAELELLETVMRKLS